MSKALIDKMDEIERIEPSEEALLRLLDLTRDNDDEIRFRAVDKLGQFGARPRIKARLIEILRDESALVRSEALDVLGYFYDDLEIVPHVASCLEDTDEIVRSSSASALGQLGDPGSVDVLRTHLEGAESTLRVSILIALILLGEPYRLVAALEMLHDSDYHARCAAANLLPEVANNENRDLILSSIKEALAKEETRAAQSSMADSIKEIESDFEDIT